MSSPRIAHRPGEPARAEALLEDVVTMGPGGTFRWLGRSSRLLKVNGRRVYLDQVEAWLRSALPDVAARCEPERHGLRGEWFSVVVETGAAHRVAEVDRVCRTLPAWQRPRMVRAA